MHSAYSHFRRADPQVVAIVSTSRWLGVPAIVLGELRHGFHYGRRYDQNEQLLREFLGHPFVELLEVDDETSSHYAALTVQLRRLGRPIPTNDAWIAALSIRERAPVLTYDQHFKELPGVEAVVLS